jgi:putative peptidoglycan lipid II flippase
MPVVLKASLKLFWGSLAGKLVGALREVLLAALFGTSGVVAALRAAQSATLIPVNFFTADSLSAGFLPLYSRYHQIDPRRAGALFWWVAGLLLLASLVVLGILLLGVSSWISLLVPGFGRDEREQTIQFVRIMGLGVPFYIAGGLFSYLEMGHGSYGLASARATLQSAGMIVGTLAAYVLQAPSLLAWGFTAAYLVFALWGGIRVVRRGWAPRPQGLTRVEMRDIGAEFWGVVKPLLLLPLLLQGNIAAERAVASLLGVDVSAALDYAKFITDTGVLLLAVPLGLAGLSAISRMSASETTELLARVIPPLLLATIPVSVALAMHGQLVVSIIYQRGNFGEASTTLTKTILWGFAIGFWAQVVSYVLMKALSAQLRNREVFRFMAIALVCNAAVNFGLYRWLGPVVLGLGGCVYGAVLLALSARALGVQYLVASRLIWLAVGSAAYGPMTLLIPSRGWAGVVSAGALFAVYWIAYVALVPALRQDLQPLWRKWRLRSA